VLQSGSSYGTSELKKGKKVIIEHTSANPNAPLHIGNLRNVIIGGILAKILQVGFIFIFF
jgi:arginyl-tRNA synthetase